MDAFTLVVAAALSSSIMAGSMGLLYIASSRQASLLHWAMAGIFFSMSNSIAAWIIHGHGAGPMLAGLGNALHVAGQLGMLAGARRHLNLRPGWGWFTAIAALVLAAHGLPFASASPVNRLYLMTPVVATINLATAWLLWRGSEREARAAYLPLVVLEVLSAVQIGLRCAAMAANDGHAPAFLGGQFLLTTGALSMLVFLSVGTMGCALIVTQQQTLALRRASLTDVLTGWLNRRALNDIATREFRRCRRTGTPAYFLTFDIDHFKSINDRYGHGVGDAAIRHVTTVSARVLRGYDALFRIGGEEFAVLLTGATLDDVVRIAERLRELVSQSPLHAQGQAVSMTVSVGVAGLEAGDHKWEDILRRADEALYHAKQHGRDRVSVHGRDVVERAAGQRLQLVGK
jgi:diguanylate cyclase (GGDEF)-like protein